MGKSHVASFLKLFDLFSLTQFLRYNQDEDYKTVSGGVTSLLVIAIFTILFAGNAISTINKDLVTWETTKESFFEPTQTSITFGSEGKFMLALGMTSMNLSDQNVRYFDVSMKNSQFINENPTGLSSTLL